MHKELPIIFATVKINIRDNNAEDFVINEH